MQIVMLEPLGVSEETLNKLAKPFIDAGHKFVPCLHKIKDKKELISKASEADVLIIANSPLDGNVIRACPHLKMISVAFTGIDHVDIRACEENNILISNAAGYCTYAVAELTFGLILSTLRKIVPCDQTTRNNGTKAGLVGNELYNKTIGIIGTGAIGTTVAKIAKVFNCQLLGCDRHENQEAQDVGITYVTLENLLDKSDIVTLHTPLTKETELLINKERISLMRPTSILINAARGGVVDSEALAEALNNDKIAGAGIDVFEMEPPIPSNHPLLNAKNTYLTPHVAFATDESMERRASITFENISSWMKEIPQNVMFNPKSM